MLGRSSSQLCKEATRAEPKTTDDQSTERKATKPEESGEEHKSVIFSLCEVGAGRPEVQGHLPS